MYRPAIGRLKVARSPPRRWCTSGLILACATLGNRSTPSSTVSVPCCVGSGDVNVVSAGCVGVGLAAWCWQGPDRAGRGCRLGGVGSVWRVVRTRERRHRPRAGRHQDRRAGQWWTRPGQGGRTRRRALGRRARRGHRPGAVGLSRLEFLQRFRGLVDSACGGVGQFAHDAWFVEIDGLQPAQDALDQFSVAVGGVAPCHPAARRPAVRRSPGIASPSAATRHCGPARRTRITSSRQTASRNKPVWRQ